MKKTVLFIMFLGCMISEAETKTIENKEVNDSTSIIISPYDKSKITNSNWSNIFGANDTITNSGYSNILGTLNTITNSKQTTAIGELNKIENSEYTKLLGNNNKINNSKVSHIFGANIQAENSNFGIAIGVNASLINAANSVAIGTFSKATFSNSVALGSCSETKLSEKSAYLTDQKNNSQYVLSVGGEKIKRRIQGLADGAEDDEAVTVAQLKKLKSEVKGSTEKSDLALGGVANAVSIANLVQVNSYSDYRHNLSAAYGYYGGSHALAIGFSGVTKDRRLVYKLSGSVNNKGNLALGVGAGVMLGNKEESLEHKDINVKELYERITKLEKENSAIKQRMIEQDTIIQKLESIIRK